MSASNPPGSGTPGDVGDRVLPARELDATQEALLARYSGLYTPVDGAFAELARMAALIFDAAIVSVDIAQDARLWFPTHEGFRRSRHPARPEPQRGSHGRS